MKTPSILAIIPARGGSKGVKNKNLVDIGGKPLIAHTLLSLQESAYDFDHIVSTDSNKIAEVAREYGGSVPFIRPKYLSTDSSNVADVVKDALNRVDKEYEYIMLLQPTCPLRSSDDIDGSIKLLLRDGVGSVCSFTSIASVHPRYMYYLSNNKIIPVVPSRAGQRRQTFRDAILRNGAIYIVKSKHIFDKRSFMTRDCLPYIMPFERSVNIDDKNDLKLARYLYATKSDPNVAV